MQSLFDLEPFHLEDGMNCLHIAIKKGFYKVVEALLLSVKKNDLIKTPYGSLYNFVNFPQRNGLRPLKMAITL